MKIQNALIIKQNSLINDKGLGLGYIKEINKAENTVLVGFKNKWTRFPLYLFTVENIPMFKSLGLSLVRQ